MSNQRMMLTALCDELDVIGDDELAFLLDVGRMAALPATSKPRRLNIDQSDVQERRTLSVFSMLFAV